MKNIYILAVNPGSTSTKIAVYHENEPLFLRNINHSYQELKQFDPVTEQFFYRKQIILKEIEKAEIQIDKIKAVVGRGGLIKPIESGVYEVNQAMVNDLRNNNSGIHASNLGGLIAFDLAQSITGAKAFIVDPVVVDELDEIARISGHPDFKRKSVFHALNQKAVAREHAHSLMKRYEDLNLIVVHLGGGITIGAHKKGRVVDVNQGLDGEGSFTPERSGTLPIGDVIRMCYSGRYSLEEMMKKVVGEGGLVGYLKTNDAKEVEKRIANNDEKADLIYNAMIYQVAKEIGAMSTVLHGVVDGILITGGIAHSTYFVNKLQERVHEIAPVHIYPGGDEMKALVKNVYLALDGEIRVKQYVC